MVKPAARILAACLVGTRRTASRFASCYHTRQSQRCCTNSSAWAVSIRRVERRHRSGMHLILYQQAASSTHSLRVTHPLPIRISFASTDRLDHSPLMIAQEKGAEGHTLHGGAVTESGEPAWPLAYEFRHGHMRNQLLTVCMQLSDANVGDGGFCVVPGSHKANFAVPPALADLADPNLNEFVRQPAVHPGDVLIFTEAVLHGTLPWTADHQRRTVIYRFAPAGSAYGRGYLPSWPAEALEGMSEAQRCVMAEPYHPRMNRTYVGKDGEAVGAKAREEFKVSFDEKVFGSKYF